MQMRKFQQSRVARNAMWLIMGSITNKLVAFLVGIWTARYLGPANYGIISYASAYTTFFFSLCTLGINSVLVKELIENKNDQGKILGSTLVMQGISSIASIFVILLIVFWVDFGEIETQFVVFLCSLGLFFQQLGNIKYWFQSRLQSKFATIATTISYIVSSLYKVYLLIQGKDVEWFALATSVDYICSAVILYIAYVLNGGPKLAVSKQISKKLLKSSYNYILSGVMVSIYGATDKLMLKAYSGESSVGYYSTAVSICNVWVFLLAAIIDSFNPVIMSLYKKDYAKYNKKNIQLYSIVFWMSTVVSVFMCIFAKTGIKILYGEEYLPAVSILRIVTWYVAFSYLGVARNAWVVCEEKQKYLKYIYAASAGLNVVLNYFLIPIIGADGAAIASLATQIFTIFGIPLVIADMRPNVKLMLEAIRIRNLSLWN